MMLNKYITTKYNPEEVMGLCLVVLVYNILKFNFNFILLSAI